MPLSFAELGLIVGRVSIVPWVPVLRRFTNDIVYLDPASPPRVFPNVALWVIPLVPHTAHTAWLRRVSGKALLITSEIGRVKQLAQVITHPVVIMGEAEDFERGITTLSALESGHIVLAPAPKRVRQVVWKS